MPDQTPTIQGGCNCPVGLDGYGWAVPELAVEFTGTLAQLWVDHRAQVIPLMLPEHKMLAIALDSVASVTIGAEGAVLERAAMLDAGSTGKPD